MNDTSTRSVTVSGIFGDAWRLTKGFKGTMWGTIILVVVFAGIFLFTPVVLAKFVLPHLLDPSQLQAGSTSMMLIRLMVMLCYIIGFFLLIPSGMAAIAKLSIERARTHEVSIKLAFRAFFRRSFPALLTLVLMYAIIGVPLFVVFIYFVAKQMIPATAGVVIAIVYALIALPYLSQGLFFAVDQTANPFAAISRSVKAVNGHYFTVLFTIILFQLLLLALQIIGIVGRLTGIEYLSITGDIFYLITLIWVLPFQGLVYGVMYHKLVD